MSTPLSVLLLEDDPSSIRLFHRKMQTAPVEIVVKDVRNREGFMRELETPSFDCIIIDYTLPDITGIEALKLVKEMTSGVPTIIYTGSVGEEKAVECMKEGAAEFLLKSNSVRLVPAILSVVNQRREYEARLRAEEAQRESEMRFRTLAETSSAIITIYQNNQLVFINSFAEEITGYTIEELKQINYLDIIHPDFKEVIRQRGIARENGEIVPTRYEFKIVRKDGGERWLDFAFGTINYRDGNATLGIGFDITARRKAEEKIQASEQRYRTMFEANPNPMWVFDTDSHCFLAVNDAAVEHYGYTRDEFLQMTIKDIIPPEDKRSLDEHLKEIEKPNSINTCTSCKHLKKDGGIIEVDAISHALEFDGHNARMILAIDVTERRRAEAALRESEANYRSLFESAKDIIFTLSLDGKITSVNQTFEISTGWTKEEWIGRRVIEILPPEEHEKLKEAFHRIYSGGPSYFREYKVIKKNGDYLIGESRLTLQIRDGEKVGFLGVLRDVTTQKKLEDQIQQTQKMESIGKLAGGIAHDFNNIMGIVYGYLSLAEQHIEDPEKVKQDIELIRTASDRGTSLVKQLLTFARKSSVVIELIDVNTLIKDLVPMLSATFPKTIDISSELHKSLPLIMADKNQLNQALLNIAVNARDAMLKGGTLYVKTDVVSSAMLKSRIPYIVDGIYVQISITDTGCGMSEITKMKAFEPFFTTKAKGKGTGLGLAVVYGIIGSHNGFVDIESEIDRGTTVHLFLPTSSMKKEESASISELVEIRGGTETILIVEDEEPLRMFLKVLLEGKGYKTIEASNGVDAFNNFVKNKERIALIVSDFGMPKLGGYELLKKVFEVDKKVKIILTSGFITPEEKSEIYKSGAKDIIMKPYTGDELLKRIRTILDENN